MSKHPITPDNPLVTERMVSQAEHNQHKAWMARERQAIVGWLRRLAGDTNPIAKLIEDGQHWKDQP